MALPYYDDFESYADGTYPSTLTLYTSHPADTFAEVDDGELSSVATTDSNDDIHHAYTTDAAQALYIQSKFWHPTQIFTGQGHPQPGIAFGTPSGLSSFFSFIVTPDDTVASQDFVYVLDNQGGSTQQGSFTTLGIPFPTGRATAVTLGLLVTNDGASPTRTFTARGYVNGTDIGTVSRTSTALATNYMGSLIHRNHSLEARYEYVYVDSSKTDPPLAVTPRALLVGALGSAASRAHVHDGSGSVLVGPSTGARAHTHDTAGSLLIGGKGSSQSNSHSHG